LKRFVSSLLFFSFWLAVGAASAAPPASCAGKFVGSWTVRVDATGQTYPSLILPNGRTQVTCPMCTPGGTWTCAGDTITVNVDNGVTTQHRLHADGRTMSGGCCTITRSGPAPAMSSDTRSQPNSKSRVSGAPPAPAVPAASNNRPRQPQSCSDITGTKDSSPAATNCKDAVGDRDVARLNRKKDPELSKYGYKKAAEAAHRAGDTALELSILREAQAPPAVETPDPDRDNNLRDGAFYLSAARAAEQNDPGCEGFTTAAEDYLQAAKFFLRADDVKQADELLRKHDALNALVDRTRQEGRCHPSRETNNQPAGSNPKEPDPAAEKCRRAFEQLKNLTASGADMTSIGTDKAEAGDRNWRIVLAARMKLVSEGCPEPDAKPFTLRECLSSRLYWTFEEDMSPQDAKETAKKAGCAG
jgi:hypothetical protein